VLEHIEHLLKCISSAVQSSLGLNSSIEIGRFDAYAASLYEEAENITNGPGSTMLQVKQTKLALVIDS